MEPDIGVSDWDAVYKWGIADPDEHIFRGMICHSCGLYIKRPDGPPWEICFQCGGVMEDSGERIPEKGEAARAIMRCRQCSNTYTMVI